jgi:hypothetical protein
LNLKNYSGPGNRKTFFQTQICTDPNGKPVVVNDDFNVLFVGWTLLYWKEHSPGVIDGSTPEAAIPNN